MSATPWLPNSQSNFDDTAKQVFENFQKTAEDSQHTAAAVSIIIALACVAGVVAIVFILYKCLVEHGLPSINFNTSGATAATSRPFATIPYSQIKMTTVENFLNDIAQEKPIRFSPKEMEGFTHNYSIKLGSGGFGAVYKGELPNGVPVAVKVLTGSLNKTVEEQFMAEVGTIGRTYHVNLVRLYGFCFDATMRALVYEYMENGSLDNYLFHEDPEIEWGTLHEQKNCRLLSTKMSATPWLPNSQSNFDDTAKQVFENFQKTAEDSQHTAAAVSIIIALACVAGVVAIVFILYKCLVEHGLPSINFNTSGATAATSRPFATIPYSQIKMTTVENFLNDIAQEKPIRFSPKEMEGFTHNYSIKLGSGGFGAVYKGELPNGVPVAVKVLTGSLNKTVEEQFMAEVGTIGRTYHVNLVRLYGFCFDATMRALVYEYMENGSLDNYLFHEDPEIEWGTLHEIAIGTAKGIRYLHEECQQRIIHYDIKPANILLDADFSPKVADFGLAKLLSRRHTHVTMTGGRGTPGYAAPEMWMPSPVTYKCDVYSFGMLLFEIVGRRRHFDESLGESQRWFPRWVWEKFENAELGVVASVCGICEEDREKAERMCKVALWCVQYQPEARPPMSKVIKMLEGEMEIAPPVNPFQHLRTSGTAIANWSDSSAGSTSTAETSDESPNEDSKPTTRMHEMEMV
ncbi:putative rust resistance kinase Lr10-like [Cocos nucifera]|uniref:Putative rust resistance kinase Lr10-like n=1 Tax=Cocos nucifera TaxID=13894 RepID=A0A8K0HTT4_COCNU|nr:putative rust resistance kinase Lr10-like [Cocos nucifera]